MIEEAYILLRLPEEIYKFIIGEVVFVFERYDVRHIPISGFEIAEKMGISLIPYSSLSLNKKEAAFLLSTDGFFFEDSHGQEFIYFNDNISYPRLNMTVLHEIGHSVLDHISGTEAEEAEANFFAKYAAAPPPLVHQICPDSPDDIARAFGLSREASRYAYNYYRKWLKYGGIAYTPYESRLLKRFDLREVCFQI